QQDARGAVGWADLLGRALVAEPERDPGAVGLLRADEVVEGPFDGARRPAGRPGGPGADRVGREIGAALVEGEPAPSAAERGNAAVGVLKPEQPVHPGA